MPQPFTPQEFFSAALEAAQQTAVFDCDGTLWSGDAGVGFKQWTIEHGLVTKDVTEWIDERYRLYLRGEVSEVAICGEMVQMYAGLPETEMREAARGFVEHYVMHRVFPEMRKALEELAKRDAEIWAVSSTNHWVIEAGVEQFGIPAERVLAAEVRSRDGLVTPELVDVPTDEGKAESLRRAGVTNPDVVFGNSVHDAAMLAMARRPFAVNPTPALEERAARDGWAVFWPAGTGTSKE